MTAEKRSVPHLRGLPPLVSALLLLLTVFVTACGQSKPDVKGMPAPAVVADIGPIGTVQAALTANLGACVLSAECTSGLCRNGVCTACAVDSACPGGRYCGAGVCAVKKASGVACGAANECLSASCAGTCGAKCGASGPVSCDDGIACTTDTCNAPGNVCVHTAATAAVCDDGNICSSNETCSAGGTCTATVANAANTIVCRVSAGGCDIVEKCTGGSTVCPGDSFQALGVSCRVVAGVCDVAETCAGGTAACPADAVKVAGTSCRAAVAGGCDIAEACDGAAVACPADLVQPAGTTCRPVAGGCDVPELCTGTNACPADTFLAVNTVCRAAVDVCDNVEKCTGTAACPADTNLAVGTSCRAAVAGGCDIAETCQGGTACPADVVQPVGTSCRASTGGCDPAELCTGTNACPANVLSAAGTVCRASAGLCDVVETCTGVAACPGDTFLAVNTVCRAAVDVCDNVEKCAGTAACPADTNLAVGTSCRPAVVGGCDIAETCQGGTACPADVVQAVGTSCRASTGGCDPAELCTGTNACPANALSAVGTVCRAAAGVCDAVETCTGVAACPGDTKLPATTVCRAAADLCDAVEKCTGAANGCPADAVSANSVVCRAVAGGCDIQEKCDGLTMVCPADVIRPAAFSCRAAVAGGCDLAEVCDGIVTSCPADLVQPVGTTCRVAAAGGCDVAETCIGTNACPANGFLPSTTVCRAPVDVCDIGENCTGAAAACPANVVVAAGTLCRASAGVCDVAEVCDGALGLCPTDIFTAAGKACTDDANTCTNDVCPGTSSACSHPATPACGNGLSVTYYDNIDFTGPAITRIDPNVSTDWGNGSPDGTIGADTFSGRFTGQVLADYTEAYTFETETDDGVRLWVNGVLLVNYQGGHATKVGTKINLVAGTRYDIKIDYYENTGSAMAKLRWSSPSITVKDFVPSDHLFPTGDVGASGQAWNSGADNGTGDPYQIWRLSDVPQVPEVLPVNATPESPNNWGLGDSVMMVPSFSPDSKHLVFIDGDSADGAGWRKGLSMFDFDQTGKSFTNRRILRNTWPSGDVMKWPIWESDSQSVIFQTSTPTELCACSTIYGNMAPTNYYGTPGTFWSMNANSGAPAVQLTQLNTGERPADANKSYQPTMLPISVGGYRWTVFTSIRPYGNVLNPPGIDRSCTASQLWVAAIDDVPAGASDRSHPAFWLPNQNIGTPDHNSYVNERGFWVKGPCKPSTSIGPESSCLTNDDCCGAPTTAACRIDQPATTPPTRHCIPVNPNVCVANGGSCGNDVDCCDFPLTHCISGLCQPPAPVPSYDPGAFTRDYVGDCPADTKAVWRFFDWQSVTPGDSSITFTAQTAATSAGLASASPVTVGTAVGPPTTGWVGEDVGSALEADSQVSQLYLRITMHINPSTDHINTPNISKWRQSYSCLPSQ